MPPAAPAAEFSDQRWENLQAGAQAGRCADGGAHLYGSRRNGVENSLRRIVRFCGGKPTLFEGQREVRRAGADDRFDPPDMVGGNGGWPARKEATAARGVAHCATRDCANSS